MSFLNPQALFLLLAVPLVLLFHLFRAKRPVLQVATLRFWRAAHVEQEPSGALFKPLRANLLLLLQILAVLLITLALAEPLFTSAVRERPRVVLILDTSASMKATDTAGNRFLAARDDARRAVAELKAWQEAMLMEASSQPRVLVPFTDDHRALEDALAALQPTDRSGDMEAAIEMAGDLVGDGPPAEIRLFTDAAFPPIAQPSSEATSLKWHRVGRGSDNVGITKLEVRRRLTGTFEFEAFLTLTNFGPAPKNFSFRVLLDGALLYRQPIDLPGGVTRSIVVPFAHQGGGLLRAEIDPSDSLKADDVVHAVLPEAPRLEVLLVTRGNLWLEKAFRVIPQVRLQIVRPDVFVPGDRTADIVVLDGHSPDFLAPRSLLAGPLASP